MLNYNTVCGWYSITTSNVTVDDSLFIYTSEPLHERCTKYHIPVQSGHALFSTLLPVDFYFNENDIVIMEGILVEGTLNLHSLRKIRDRSEVFQEP